MIDTDRAVELLQEVVSDKGDGHKSMNMYKDRDTGEPVCIVGHVLDKLEMLNRIDATSDYTVPSANNNYRDVAGLKRHGYLPEFSEGAIKVLQIAQAFQDFGCTWGEALVAVKDEFNGC